jgi:[ribosomal protein S5]-alanine N-acetyltransferase
METAGGPCSGTGSWHLSPRLVLRPVPWDVVLAVAAGHRLGGWADDYPSEGDVVIMDLLHRAGADAWPGADQAWGHRQIVERDSGLAVGGIGFAGPPDRGEVEVGYGIVPSRQGRGYATEALHAMVAMAWAQPAVTAVLAGTDPGNVASQRVLEKAGFRRVSVAGQYRYRLNRPCRAD